MNRLDRLLARIAREHAEEVFARITGRRYTDGDDCTQGG